MGEEFSEKVQISFGRGLEPITFQSFDDLSKWIEHEKEFWKWLEQPPITNLNISGELRAPFGVWQNVNNAIPQLKQSPSVNRQNLLQGIQGNLSSLYENSQWLPSSSPRAVYVTNLKDKDQSLAAYTLYAFLNKPIPQNVYRNNEPTIIRAFALAAMFDYGLSQETLIAEKDALEKLHKDWTVSLNAAHEAHAESDKELKALHSSGEAQRNNQQKAFDEMMEKAQAKFDDVTHTYNQKLALLAPVQYWDEKAKSHLYSSIWIGASCLAVAALVAFLIWREVDFFLITGSSGANRHTPEYWQYGLIIVTASFLVWPLRILVRMLLSHLHLRADARERVTMVRTYLSLSREGQGLPESDRRLILEALFRPASTGIVRDDAAPASVMQLLSRSSSGDR
jgi:hypothetical protein